jgi:hypothetical protein
METHAVFVSLILVYICTAISFNLGRGNDAVHSKQQVLGEDQDPPVDDTIKSLSAFLGWRAVFLAISGLLLVLIRTDTVIFAVLFVVAASFISWTTGYLRVAFLTLLPLSIGAVLGFIIVGVLNIFVDGTFISVSAKIKASDICPFRWKATRSHWT